MDDGKRGLEENIANVERLPLPMPITNAREMEMSKCESIQFQQPMGNDAVPPTPWTVKAATLLIDVLCAVVVCRILESGRFRNWQDWNSWGGTLFRLQFLHGIRDFLRLLG